VKHGPYEAEEPPAAAPEGAFIGFRSWMALPCLQGRHDSCSDRTRCDCQCHAFTTGALRLHQEPS
jgi:hypothetical protein